MRRHILTVEETFQIQGRGLVIAGRKTGDLVDFNIGDSIEIENPDQTIIKTKVRGIERFSKRNLDENSEDFHRKSNLLGFLTENNVEKNQVSIGAKVWLLIRDS